MFFWLRVLTKMPFSLNVSAIGLPFKEETICPIYPRTTNDGDVEQHRRPDISDSEIFNLLDSNHLLWLLLKNLVLTLCCHVEANAKFSKVRVGSDCCCNVSCKLHKAIHNHTNLVISKTWTCPSLAFAIAFDVQTSDLGDKVLHEKIKCGMVTMLLMKKCQMQPKRDIWDGLCNSFECVADIETPLWLSICCE